jgi:hypothetical protein
LISCSYEKRRDGEERGGGERIWDGEQTGRQETETGREET